MPCVNFSYVVMLNYVMWRKTREDLYFQANPSTKSGVGTFLGSLTQDFLSEVLFPRPSLLKELFSPMASFHLEALTLFLLPLREVILHKVLSQHVDGSPYNSSYSLRLPLACLTLPFLLRGGSKFFTSTRQAHDANVSWSIYLSIMFLEVDHILWCSARQIPVRLLSSCVIYCFSRNSVP